MNKSVSENDLASLRLACYVGTKDFILSAMKANKKKGNLEKYDVCHHVAKIRGFLPVEKP